MESDSIELEISGGNSHKAILKFPQKLQLAPLESVFLPIKFLASKALIKQEQQEFKFLILINKINENSLEYNSSFITFLPMNKRLYVILDKPEFYILPNVEETKLNFTVSNPSLFKEQYILKLYDLPKGYKILEKSDPQWIEGRSKQEVTLTLKHPLIKEKNVDFHFSLALKQQKKDTPMRYTLRMLKLEGLLDLAQDARHGENSSSISNEINYLTSNYMNSFQLKSSSEMYLPKNKKLEYALQFNHFLDQSTYQLFNSQINYSFKNWMFAAGSLHENLNYNLNGKGLKVAHENNDRKWNVLVMDNDLVILGNESNRKFLGYNIAFEYLKGIKTKENTRLLAVYNKRPDLQLENSMVNLEQKLWKSKIHIIEIESGISRAKYAGKTRKKSEIGYAGGLNYSGKFENIGLQTLNYFSHPNFTGNRRGALQSEFLLDFTPNAGHGLTLGWTFNRNKIKTNDLQYADVLKDLMKISQMNASLSYQNKLSKSISIGFGPYYLHQFMDRMDAEQKIIHNASASWRFRKSLGYYDKKNTINLNVDHGLTSHLIGNKKLNRFYSFRANAQMKYKDLSIHMFYQYNPYFLSDGLTNLNFGKYHVVNFESKYARYFLNKRLYMANSLMYYYHGDNQHSNYVWNGEFSFKMLRGIQLRGDFYFGINRMQRLMLYNPETGIDPNPIVFNRRDQTLLSTRQVRLGISKDIVYKKNNHVANLKMKFFHDQNGNGIRDKDESLLAGVVVKMHNLLAQSDKDGFVKFKLVKGKTYHFDLQSHNGWFLSNNSLKQINIIRNLVLEIPLVKMTMVKGRIVQKMKEYQQKINDFSDYQIIFRAETGSSYQTRSNIKGGFIISLPDGNYKVDIIPRQEYIEVIENGKNVLIKDGKEVGLEFEVINSSRKVKISTF